MSFQMVLTILQALAAVVQQSGALHPRDANNVRKVLRTIDTALEKPALMPVNDR